MSRSARVDREGRIVLALKALDEGQITTIREAADLYDVPKSTLHRRVKGVQSRVEAIPNNLLLTVHEEEALLQYILDLDAQGFPPRRSLVEAAANLLLNSRGEQSPKTCGKNWVSNFVNRKPQLKSAYNRRYDYKRALCEDPLLVRNWFSLVRNTVAKYGIVEDDIYNFDETGFAMGLITTSKVITGSDNRLKPVTLQPGNRNWATVIHSVSAKGGAIPPLIILAGKNHLSSWYETPGLPKDWAIAVSDSGWSNDDLGALWIQHFHSHTFSKAKGPYRLLIMDGHGSHHTARLQAYCKEQSIITLCMPPHSSHLLQPLDVGCFSPLKRAYGAQVELKMRYGVNHITKEQFLEAYLIAHKQAITESNILSGFRASGLVPFNPQRVLDTLIPIQRTPSPPLSTASTWSGTTPLKQPQLRRMQRHLRGQQQRRGGLRLSPRDEAIRMSLKAAELAMHSSAILLEENVQLRKAMSSLQRHKRKKKKRLSQGGALTIEEGIEKTSQVDIEQQVAVDSGEVAPEATHLEPPKRAPRRCSRCESTLHDARKCPKAVG
jgi:hypothetical protein